MDSFTSIVAYFASTPQLDDVPIDEDHGGPGGNAYCVIA